MKYLVLMAGIPGSGKTTFAQEMVNSYNVAYSEGLGGISADYICPDAIREELSGDANNQKVSAEAWKLAYERLHAALSRDTDVVVFDAVLANPKTRLELVDIAKQHNADVVYILMATPFIKALERNDSRERKVPAGVIQNFANRFNTEFPALQKDRRGDL